MNLFALSRGEEQPPILRIPLTAELRREVARAFVDQLAAFESGVEHVLPFDGRYMPEDDEAIVINQFQDVDGIIDAIERPMRVELFDSRQHSLENVKALFLGHRRNGHQAALIQSFERRRLISKKTLSMLFSGDTFQRIQEDGLTLDSHLLAVLENGAITFKSFHFLRRVFDLSEHYREATNEEVEAFVAHDNIMVEDAEAFVAAAGPLIRKKISFISQSGILDSHTGRQIANAARQFNLQVRIDGDDRIVLPTDKAELRKLLKFLDEDYYESALSKSHFVSNSKRPAD
ncbi:hypothetical protein BTRA_3380 [Burkholderia thailandensis USAMRU Malaysia |uniref:Kiwa anti-phage protein KwaB-like domain-containing protein n=1 Tax=Burkholderia thailandensis TaxID=57975 RepID=UPI0003EC7F3E|nr:Kiwa anti-phage protein KwaB-like domain-containing protein [Burkholderia thailandensis]AHI80139.1 hypothetical protein BTJ_1802 [Burkholderia thailandensis E444]AIC88014.1 hypothetical protein BTRA_3380 [Burkholderia thailandensis USAMRU Malaysia \